MTLATLRAHVWKGGNDVLLYYKSNGKKSFEPKKPVAEAAPAEEDALPANPAAT
jgi:WD repeat-containing protein 48